MIRINVERERERENQRNLCKQHDLTGASGGVMVSKLD